MNSQEAAKTFKSRFPPPDARVPEDAIVLCYLRMLEYGRMTSTVGDIMVPLYLMSNLQRYLATYPAGYNFPDWKVQTYIELLPAIVWEARAIRRAAYVATATKAQTLSGVVNRLKQRNKFKAVAPVDTLLRFNEMFGIFNILKPKDDIAVISDCQIRVINRRSYANMHWPNRLTTAILPVDTDIANYGSSRRIDKMYSAQVGEYRIHRAYRPVYEGVQSSAYFEGNYSFKPLSEYYTLLPVEIARMYEMVATPAGSVRDIVCHENKLRVDKWKYAITCGRHNGWMPADTTWEGIEL